jgi:hypothetical protein
MMRRDVPVALVIACLLACGVGVWVLRGTMVWPFVLSDATHVVVTSTGLDSFAITYRVDGPPYSWREDIGHQLAESGWRSRDYTFGFTRRFTATWYSRTLDFGLVSILESVVVGGDPNDPHVVLIRTHRELHFPLWSR